MISGDARFDKLVWKNQLYRAVHNEVEAGTFGQDDNTQPLNDPETTPETNAVVHCVEAMPITSNHPQNTVKHWDGKTESLYIPL